MDILLVLLSEIQTNINMNLNYLLHKITLKQLHVASITITFISLYVIFYY